MAKIPHVLWEPINTAFPAHVCLIGMTLPHGFAQVTPKGSAMESTPFLRCNRPGCDRGRPIATSSSVGQGVTNVMRSSPRG